jgi:hypothetical protein
MKRKHMGIYEEVSNIQSQKHVKFVPKEETPFPLLALPNELLGIVFDRISPEDMVMVCSTNKLFRSFEFDFKLRGVEILYSLAPNDLEKREKEIFERKKALTTLTIRASKEYNTKTLMWLKENGVPWADIVVEKASSAGNVEILSQFNRNTLLKKCEEGRIAASINGHVNVLEWFAMNVTDVGLSGKIDENEDYRVELEAVYGGHLNVLKWSYARNKEFRIYSIDQLVSIHGHVHILEWLLSKGIIGRRSVVPYSGASHGHLRVVKFAHENGFVLSKGTWEIAYMRAHWHILDWALEMGNLLFKTVHSKTLHGWKHMKDEKVPYVKYINEHISHYNFVRFLFHRKPFLKNN